MSSSAYGAATSLETCQPGSGQIPSGPFFAYIHGFAGHAASLIIQGLSLAGRVNQAHDEDRDITDAEIAGATEAALQAADEFALALSELQRGQS